MLSIIVEGRKIEFDHKPDVCPRCHHNLDPIILVATLSGTYEKRGTLLEISYKCTHRQCQGMFIGQYQKETAHSGTGSMQGAFIFQKAVPINFISPEIDSEVEEISPSFKEIYNQACAAESYGLDEIAGVGFRKALEFLIKDYCVHKTPDKKEDIETKLLGQVINTYVDDTNLVTCAKRAAWLGNDETHYIRKWEDKDISDLKTLINLSSGWVKSNILTEKYLQEMP